MTVAASTSGLPERLAGRYRVLGSVGRGAIAEVVRARDERTGVDVALKILYPHLRESAAVVERFRREVEIVRKIAHPHVLSIHEVVDSDGHLFLVMDYCPGGDLADRLAARGRFDASSLRDLAAQLCGALAAAHRAGVVHRDVKPSNVLCGAGTQLDVRLCDFGLARSAELSGLTTANAVLGTPEYMAPEIVVDGHADPRSDIYSLGVMLFEAATGKLPFYGDSPYQLMRQHVDVEAPRARSLAPDLPPAIDAAIARALAKDPLDRFATVDDFARAFAADAPKEVTTTGAVAVAPRPRAGRTCGHCGGWVVDIAGVCADCGRTLLRLDYQEDGVSVLVTGPGRAADKLDAWKQVALYKLLDELPVGSVRVPRGRRRAPRVPFYVAKGITEESANALVARLEAIGFTAFATDGSSLARQEIRQKIWQSVSRPLAGFGVIFWQWHLWMPKSWGTPWLLALPLAIVGLAVPLLADAVVRSVRPIVWPAVGEGLQRDAVRRLAGLLGRLGSRPDRRLIGHILDRLGQIDTQGNAAAAEAVADRAAQAAAGLAALDMRRRAGVAVTGDSAGAQTELRREERLRVMLRADLLRASSWLDRLCIGAARGAAIDAGDALKQLGADIEELGLAVDAEVDVAALLRDGR